MPKASDKLQAHRNGKKRAALGVEITSLKHVQPRKQRVQAVALVRPSSKAPKALEEDSLGLGDEDYEVDVSLVPKEARVGAKRPMEQLKVDGRSLKRAKREAVLASAKLNMDDMKASVDALNLFDQPGPEGENQLLLNFEKAFAPQLAQAHAEASREGRAPTRAVAPEIAGALAADPVISQAFQETGEVLSKYRSGPLPKILKGVPASVVWAAALELTAPSSWTPHATLEVTKYFVMQLPEDQAAIYLQDFLLPRLREALIGKSKLPVQLFEALGKATYKPRAFLKGLVFPCTLEACPTALVRVLTSSLRQGSVPVKVAAPAIYKLASQEWSPTVSAFLGALLDKGYTLPVSAVEQVVRHYEATARQAPISEQLPLVYHYSLLIFARRYASSMTGEQQARLLAAVARCRHSGGISDEIVRVFKTSASGSAAIGGANELLI